MPHHKRILVAALVVVLALSVTPMVRGIAALLPAAGPSRAVGDGRATADEFAKLVREIQGDVEDLRGLEFLEDVPFELMDADGVDAFVRRQIERQGGPELIAFSGGVAQILGLIAPDEDLLETVVDLMREQVAGLYDPHSKRFHLREELHPALELITLAHELVHALDDQHFDLGAAMDARLHHSDRLWAYQAVAEGSAMVVHNQWMTRNIRRFDARGLSEAVEQSSRGLADAPEALWKPMIGAYLRGAAFLMRTSDGLAAQTGQPRPGDVDRALEDPPESSEQILHPEKYWSEEHYDPPVPVRFSIGELPAGWSVLGEDTLGEIGLAFATERPSESPAFDPLSLARLRLTNEAAMGWGGDRHALFARDGALVMVAHVVFDTDRDVEEFTDALRELGPWRLERLAALTAHLAPGPAEEAEPSLDLPPSHGELVLPVVGAPAVRWVLFAGTPLAEAERLSSLVTVD